MFSAEAEADNTLRDLHNSSYDTKAYIHTYTLFILEIYRVAVELMYSRK